MKESSSNFLPERKKKGSAFIFPSSLGMLFQQINNYFAHTQNIVVNKIISTAGDTDVSASGRFKQF